MNELMTIRDWPHEISLEAFQRTWRLQGEPLWLRVFAQQRDKMQIKNVRIALVNLEKIFTSTFRLANSKGFQAMSLRDLSKDTGISMGGLYAYIGSKDDLASVIEGVLRQSIDDVASELSKCQLGPVDRLKAIIYGDLYMCDVMSNWYYFCYLEGKGLSKEQKQKALEMELAFDERIVAVINAGIEQGLFVSDRVGLMASHTTHMLQQWYLKRWKYSLSSVKLEDYADFVYRQVLQCLHYGGVV